MNKITVLEYANIKGVSKQAVQQQISKGKLKAEKIDGQWFINEVPSIVTNPSASQQASLGTNQQASADNQKELLDQLKSGTSTYVTNSMGQMKPVHALTPSSCSLSNSLNVLNLSA